MTQQKHKSNLISPIKIGEQVRTLRTARRWTQAELAAHLDLSQSRLSELERGQGSFTAEQFLEILRLFSVGVDAFAPTLAPAEGLQNALARFGARHLRETSALLDPAYSTPAAVLTAVLLHPVSERHVTALAPVLVWSIDKIPLAQIQYQITNVGRPGRLPWLVENIIEAIKMIDRPQRQEWRRQESRAKITLQEFQDHPPRKLDGQDLFDTGVRSLLSIALHISHSSNISKKWNIVSTLQPDDFALSLREAYEH